VGRTIWSREVGNSAAGWGTRVRGAGGALGNGAASAREIYQHVGNGDGLAYTTIATVLDRLHEKALVSRKRVGKAFVYRPKVKRETLERARARDVLRRLLRSEPQPAIANLVEAVEAFDPKLLDTLARAVEDRRRSRRGS